MIGRVEIVYVQLVYVGLAQVVSRSFYVGAEEKAWDKVLQREEVLHPLRVFANEAAKQAAGFLAS